jgi:hypothetical protein
MKYAYVHVSNKQNDCGLHFVKFQKENAGVHKMYNEVNDKMKRNIFELSLYVDFSIIVSTKSNHLVN